MKAKYKGHCQCCGRQQSVVNGFMSNHGYKVKKGWFEGVCGGRNYPPLEVDRQQTDRIIESISEEIPRLLEQSDQVKNGLILPKTVTVGNFRTRREVPYEEASPLEQRQGVDKLVWSLKARAHTGKDFIETMKEIADKYHGKDLITV